jgi:hypothetical protein
LAGAFLIGGSYYPILGVNQQFLINKMSKVLAIAIIVLGMAISMNASAYIRYNKKQCDSKYRKLMPPASDAYSALRIVAGSKNEAKDILSSEKPDNASYAYYYDTFWAAKNKKDSLFKKGCKKHKKAIYRFNKVYDLPSFW